MYPAISEADSIRGITPEGHVDSPQVVHSSS